ncbi:MAG: hypothetical protein ACR2J6_08100 [Thermoleophilaceae bacterium]
MSRTLELDPAALQAMLDARVPVEEVARAGGPDAPPWLTAAAGVARAPAFRLWTEGEAPAATVYGGETCLLVVEPGTVVGLATEEVPVALWGILGLGPRPAPADGGAVRLAPGPMAVLIGNRQAHGHGLAPEAAAALQLRLDAGVRHWSLSLGQPLPDGRQRRRNLEILDGEAGIWRIRQVTEELVELAHHRDHPPARPRDLRQARSRRHKARTQSQAVTTQFASAATGGRWSRISIFTGRPPPRPLRGRHPVRRRHPSRACPS